MKNLDRTSTFIGAQAILFLCALGMSALIFTLAPLIISIIQAPINAFIFARSGEVKFWGFVARAQAVNITLFILLVALIQIFGRRYFLIFLDVNAWSF